MYDKSAFALSQAFKSGEITARKIAEYSLKRIADFDTQIGAFLTLFQERMLQKAEELDKKRKSNKRLGKLAGVPIALKDNIHVKGEVSSCGSKILSNYRPPFHATVTELLEQEDALIIGKTNMDEFAMGSSGKHSAFFPTKNPWALSCSPGGSSSGSAAAVSARFCPLALGSDTGGSIRQPAALCGIVGFKPTYGRVSRFGLVAFASSLDQIGPLATNVRDAALVMEVIGKHCKQDATSLSLPDCNLIADLENPIKGKTIGVPWDFLDSLPDEAKTNFAKCIETFKEMGVKIVPVDLNVLKYSIPAYYILATAEASANLARFDGIRYGHRSSRATTLEEVYEFSRQEGFGTEVKGRILLGSYVLSAGYQDAYYRKAQKVRTLIIRKLREAFSTCSIIALPCSPTTAFGLEDFHDPVEEYLQDLYTICANLAGLPAISIPSGFDTKNKPFGLQMLAPLTHESELLQFAHAFEKMSPSHQKIPPLFDREAS